MPEYFDEATWRQATTRSDWYIELYPELQRLRSAWENASNPAADDMKRAVRGFFEAALLDGLLALGSSGPNLDVERQSVDTIVIHHTSAAPGYRLPYMNATQMLNVYVPYFNNPTDDEKELRGQPLWSNHVRGGRPVFFLYHWLMRMDGSTEHLLNDNELGWHAANWDINRRSVAICLDNDYEKSDPDPKVLQSLAQFIVSQYPQVPPERMFGHGEVSQRPTVCPGTNFESAWKGKLLRLVEQARAT